MAYSNKVPVLVIEDEDEHYRQISEKLGDVYQTEHLKSVDNEKLYNYKALNPDSQIIIVDLVLDTEDDAHEGLKAIVNTIWPIDRTTFFIVFSRYIESTTVRSINEVEPHWTFVKKEFSDEQLSSDCLVNLYNIVEACRRYSSPTLSIPFYDPYDWTDQIDNYVSTSEFGEVPFHNTVRENIIRSVKILNELSQEAGYYVKAGEEASQLAIVVYGSCGRLEMREDSDIECSVYYSERTPSGDLAVAFWNRITRYMKVQQDLKYEGQTKIESSPTGLLVSTQADEVLQNAFYPVINKDLFLDTSLNLHPHIRNRHYQVLTEVRPVFNEDFIFHLKKELIQKHTNRTTNLATIIRSPYMVKVVTQFSMDAEPESLNHWEDMKRFCYRTLSIWSLRLALIGRLKFGDDEYLNDDSDWQEFFDLLVDPGIVKVIRFFKDSGDHVSGEGKKELMSELGAFIESYFRISSRFTKGEKNPDELKGDVFLTATHFIKSLEQLKQMNYFKGQAEDVSWLFSTDKIMDDLRVKF